MSNEFRLGEVVKLKSDLIVGKYYGNCEFTGYMAELTGCILTINKVMSYAYMIEGQGCLFTAPMLDLAIKSTYRVMDKVRLRTDYNYNPYIEMYAGQPATILKVFHLNEYDVECMGVRFSIKEEAIEPLFLPGDRAMVLGTNPIYDITSGEIGDVKVHRTGDNGETELVVNGKELICLDPLRYLKLMERHQITPESYLEFVSLD